MENMEGRIALQRSRFALIQNETDQDNMSADRMNRHLISARLDMLEQNWNKFQEEHENLCLSASEDLRDHSYLRERIYERCQAFYVYARAMLFTQLEEFDTADRHSRSSLLDQGASPPPQEASTPQQGASTSQQGASTSQLPRSALPRIQLPIFSGDYPTWRTFHDTFTSMIKNNFHLTDVEKMHYLKTCVKDEAARMIGNLDVSGDNFLIAWNLLVSRYENTRFLIEAQLDKITSLKPFKTKNAIGLRNFMTTVSETTAALRSLGCAVDKWDPLLLHQVVKLLDPESREAWEVKQGSSTTYPTLEQFEEFLTGRTRAMNLNPNMTQRTSAASTSGKPYSKVAAHAAASACPLCGSSHYLAKCERYQSKTAKQRKEIVIRHKRCFNCLAPHLVKKCTSVTRCLKCGKKHHTTLHENQREILTTPTSTPAKPANQSEEKSDPSANRTRKLTLLATSRALVKKSNGDFHPVRLLIDQGSELSFITEDLVQRAQLTRTAASIPLLGIGGTYSGNTKGSVFIQLHSIHDSALQCQIRAFILPRLTAKLPSCSVSAPTWPHISGLQLADPEYYVSGTIQVIIGSDNFHVVIRQGMIPGDSSSPTAQQTIFGWVLCGPMSAAETPVSAHAHHCSPDQELQDLLSRFWTQEEIPKSTIAELTEEEEECERHFLTTYSRDATGRYVVRLPLKINLSVLGDSKAKALGCLKNLFQRFSNQSTFQQLYEHFLEEYLKMGHMKEVDASSAQTSVVNYLPHHGVLRENNRTTKLRVVFNGSSPTSNGLSLNDILHAGAKLQIDICDILLWIRTHKVLFSTDIVKMFRQIAVHQDDWNLQRILWIGSEQQLLAYCLTTVTYGLRCAPFLALRALEQLVKEEGHRFPKAIIPMKKGRFVDNIYGGSDTTLEAKDIIQQVKGSRQYHLQKKAIASDIAKLYDPLGLISPIIIRAKIILQELWLLKTGWDELIPVTLQERWTAFRQQLLQLEPLSIPRWLGVFRCDTSRIEIHGFSDASQLAMAAARLTIPRLELTAALLLARLIAKVVKALELFEALVFCWSDSEATIKWITANPSRWKDFVRNRVSAIQELLPNGSWRFVPGKQNPADLATRGLKADKLFHLDLWWKGPTWLSESQASWPYTEYRSTSDIDMEERPGYVMIALVSLPPYWELLRKYSSLTRLPRVTATCRRFVNCLRKVPQSSPSNYPLTPIEIQQSRDLWVRIVQQTWFHEEIRLLVKGEQLPKSNSLNRLTPFIDRDGLLRVGGRLHFAQINMEAKHPLILPRRSPLTTLVIEDTHRRSLHGGTQVTLSLLRENFWIIGGRAPIRSHILRCGRCVRYRGIRAKQMMGQLPSVRVNPARPFSHSGLDYAGPVTLKTWRGQAAKSYKGYLAIFVCLATSAVHIEVVTDYTTEAFIAAYKRFNGRRGICSILWSDCGTNFMGANAELKRLFQQSSHELGDIASLLANDGTEWRFNPPCAPHFGGKWEAAVKSVKFHPKRVLGEKVLTYEEMTTITIQIEA
ncbi:uncharacterized protein LOC112451723, partial [Temnothorax curvispinosus]|uniref:Uncharacterized protein LOC112451723 n=1 Tax=Temnothorax curvispinosus TaxID=300111 RepID=A0A6J1PCX6_9HYME